MSCLIVSIQFAYLCITNPRIFVHDGGPTRHRGDELSKKLPVGLWLRHWPVDCYDGFSNSSCIQCGVRWYVTTENWYSESEGEGSLVRLLTYFGRLNSYVQPQEAWWSLPMDSWDQTSEWVSPKDSGGNPRSKPRGNPQVPQEEYPVSQEQSPGQSPRIWELSNCSGWRESLSWTQLCWGKRLHVENRLGTRKLCMDG